MIDPITRRLAQLIAGLVPTAVCAVAVAAETAASRPAAQYLRADPDQMQWWRDAKFGMFVCWGPVSLTGLEIGWSRGGKRPGTAGGTGPTPVEIYDNLYRKWKPKRFDARKWVRIATDAGARYMIFLVKHHDGFCLYDTKLTSYKSTSPASAWQHDVMADVAKACHDAGLKLFIYYSQPDWHHPDYRTANHARYIRYLHGQIRELLTNYGRIDGLWFDGLGGKAEDWDAPALFQLARGIQPHLIINGRCGLPGDFDTPEQKIGPLRTDRPWESCITLGTQWSWKPNDKIKSLKQCIDTLVTCVGRGGNLALNTGPMPDGRIESRQADRFREIGKWLRRFGHTLYATRPGPILPADWGVSTQKDSTVYIHVLKWPDHALTLPPIPRKILAASALTDGPVTVRQTDHALEVSLPSKYRHDLDTIIALTLDTNP